MQGLAGASGKGPFVGTLDFAGSMMTTVPAPLSEGSGGGRHAGEGPWRGLVERPAGVAGPGPGRTFLYEEPGHLPPLTGTHRLQPSEPPPRRLPAFLKVKCHIPCSTDVVFNLLTEKRCCRFIRFLLFVSDEVFACWAANHLFS